jgi:hypothetical protein
LDEVVVVVVVVLDEVDEELVVDDGEEVDVVDPFDEGRDAEVVVVLDLVPSEVSCDVPDVVVEESDVATAGDSALSDVVVVEVEVVLEDVEEVEVVVLDTGLAARPLASTSCWISC